MSVPEKSASKKSRISRREKRRADTSANSMSMVRWYRQRKPYKRPRIWKDNEMDSQVDKDQLEEKEMAKVETAGDSKPPYKPDYQYSREELLKYSDSPLSRQKPVVTDSDIENLFCWLKWNNNYNKRSDTPTDRGDDSYKRRSNNDPRERVRKEQDGIVLSPQRRSFNSGCFVTVTQNPVTRPEPVKDGPPPPRRIGSGRIMNRDNWDYRDKENNEDGYYRTSIGPNPRERDDRFDIRRNYSGISMDRELMAPMSRESLQRDKDLRSDVRAGRDRDRMQRFSNDRRRFENEEPEWFSGGPTSQHDTIELRGFEDTNENGNRNKNKPASKNLNKFNAKDSRSNTESRKSSSEEISFQKGNLKDSELERPAANSSPKSDHPKNESDLPPADEANRTENHDYNFNLEDFLQLDNLPLLGLPNGGSGEGNQSSSRFSQWFRRDSPPDVNDTRRSSIQDEIIKNIINDISEPSINIPNMKDSDAYFAPISPAGTTSGNSLLEMLQGNHQQNDHRGKPPSIKDLEATGKLTSLEELEARMRQGAVQSPVTQNSQNQLKKGVSTSKKDEELIAFKKLLKQVVEGGATPASVIREQAVRSPALNQMLNKPPEPSDMMGQAHQPNAAASMHVPQDLVYKLLHVQEQQRQVQQQQEINKLLFQSGRLAPPQVHGALSPLPPELQVLVANSQPSPELLNRPEAQAILQGLRQGEITPQHLVQQLQNQAMQPRHREVLASILKLHGGSPRPASPLMVPPPDPALIQQFMLQQQLRIPSPLPPMPNGLPHRVPSPRELMLHTQTIMQSALIKKKLEEQRENYRKRQELQRATSPNVAAGAKSPNPNNIATSSANNNANNNPTSTPSTNNNNNNNNINPSSTPTAASTTTTTTTGAAAAGVTNNSNTSATKSPTPLAFTPTSVLRKMTAEQPQPKDGDGKKNQYNDLLKLQHMQQQQRQNELIKMQQAAQAAQSSRFLTNNQLLNMRSPQQQWSMPKQTMQQPMQQGRAIVKGSGNFAPAPPPGPGLVDLPYGNNARPVYPQRSKLTMTTTPLVQPNLYNNFPSSANRGPPNRGFAPQMGPLAQHNVNMNPALQQLLMSQNMTSAQQRNVYKQPDIRNSFHQFLPGNGDGDLSTSPTASNQLAHWFTPELLAQAQAQTRSGKADSTVNMVSVEELERHQQNSAPVLN